MPRLLLLLTLLSACVYVSPEDLEGRKDKDGDGYGLDVDCDDSNPRVHPHADEIFYDGVDQNCAPDDDADQDGDGFDLGADCDDANASAHPGADETFYDGVDGDCSGTSDFDQDGDQHDRAADGGDDCDDLAPEVNPSVTEVWYNGLDEDCDKNDGDQDGDGLVPDAYAAAVDWTTFEAHAGTGDCWDDPADLEGHETIDGSPLAPDEVNPGATETWYDGVDQDCASDDDFDQDGDGFASRFHADGDGIYGDDCIDGAPEDAENPAGLDPAEVNPAATETWYDGTDQDCAEDNDYDQDRDEHAAVGYGDGDDCDDTRPAVNPDAVEDCVTPEDDDCDSATNEPDATGCSAYYADLDGDTYFGADSARCLCAAEAPYTSSSGDDCDDGDATVSPGADEVLADGVDQDCDSTELCYPDVDLDGYGDPAASDLEDGAVRSPDLDCTVAGVSTAALAIDCDDSSASTNPAATEIMGDGRDQDCDGQEICYADADLDGYGDASASGWVASTDLGCTGAGESTATLATDCDDADPSRSPAATELTGDEVDQDCDGSEDCHVDADLDGFGDAAQTAIVTSSDTDCSDVGESTTTLATDCDDTSDTTWPGAIETCEDWMVNDCDGTERDALAECGWISTYTVSSAYASRYGESASTYAGASVAFFPGMDGDDWLLIGAPGHSSSQGLAYVLLGSPDAGRASLADYEARVSGESAGDRFGSVVASAGDLDDDGYGDVLIGAPYRGSSDYGAAYLYSGVALTGTLPAPAGATVWVGSTGDQGGTSIAGIGDLEGDGYADVLVGAPRLGSTDVGGVYLLSGPTPTTGLLGAVAAQVVEGAASSDHLGSAAAPGGDVDGDGVRDILFAGSDCRTPGSATDDNVGVTYLILGPAVSSGVADAVADAMWIGAAASDASGTSIAGDADVNGDGYDDVLIGAPGADSSAADAGAAYLVYGSAPPRASMSLSGADVTLLGEGVIDRAGTTVAMGDLTGDGAPEVLIGVPLASPSGATAGGAAYLLFASSLGATLSLSAADQIIGAERDGDGLGAGISAGGDADSDGYGDLLIGAPYHDELLTDDGQIYFIPGTGF